jgi:hypothetical protein
MTHVSRNHSRLDSSDAVISAYINEISTRHAPAPSGQGRRGDRQQRMPRRRGARRGHSPAAASV